MKQTPKGILLQQQKFDDFCTTDFQAFCERLQHENMSVLSPLPRTLCADGVDYRKVLTLCPGGSDSKSICLQCGRPLGQEDPLEKAMATHSSTLAWKFMDGGAWWATVHGVAKSRTRLSNFTCTFCVCLSLFHCAALFPHHRREPAMTLSRSAGAVVVNNFGTGDPLYGRQFFLG